MGWLTGRMERKNLDGLFRMIGGPTPDPEYPSPHFLNHVSQGWGKNELVYACIQEKATSLPEGTLRVYDALGRRGEPVQGHPLRRLLSRPNALMSEFELFELTCLHLDLAGNAFWEKVRDRSGKVTEVWPLRPDRVRMVRSTHQVSYRYILDSQRSVPVDVVHFKLPNPIDPMVGTPPMRAALRATALDNQATDFVKALLQNHAIPGVVVKMAELDHVLDDAVTDRLKAKWKQSYGGSRRGEPAFLQAGMEVQQLGLDLKDLEFPDLRAESESRICAAFGVPPIIVGAKIGLDRSTFSNFQEARKAFWEQTLMPLQRRVRDTIDAQLLQDVSTGGPGSRGLKRVSLRWDNSEVIALRESEADRWNRGTEAFRAGGLTVNEYRRVLGEPDVDGGDIFLMPSGVIATRDMEGAVESLNGRQPLGSFDQPAPDDTGKSIESPEVKRRQTMREKAEKKHERALTDFYVIARGDVGKALSAKTSLPVTAWREDLAGRLYKAGFAASKMAALSVLKTFDAERIEGWHHARAQGLAKVIVDALNDDAQEALVNEDPKQAVTDLFTVKDNTAGVDATQMATTTLAWGAREAGKQASDNGHRATKTWITGDNPRPDHAAMSGETVEVYTAFSNGMQYPGDSIGDVDQIAGCNCSVTINIED